MRSYKRPYTSQSRLNTDERIENYKEAYYKVYQKIPKTRKSGAWIYITTNDGIKTIRSKDLPMMILELDLKEMKIQPTESEKYYSIEICNIKADIVKLFFERLHDRCHSTFEMEECLMNYALSNKLTHGLRPKFADDEEDEYGYGYSYEEKTIKLELMIGHLEDENTNLEKKIKSLSRMIIEKEAHYNDQFEKLKQESILFSMDDFELKEFDEDESIKKNKVYDDIPF